jgi:hypothetical protein
MHEVRRILHSARHCTGRVGSGVFPGWPRLRRTDSSRSPVDIESDALLDELERQPAGLARGTFCVGFRDQLGRSDPDVLGAWHRSDP